MSSTVKKVLNIILDIVIVVILVLAVLLLVLSLSQKSGSVSHIFGYSFRSVQTSSMEPEISAGDMVVCKMSDADSYKVGDVVLFAMPVINENGNTKEADLTHGGAYDQEIFVVHRIVRIEEDGGYTRYVTRGDNNPGEDVNRKTADEIVAVYEGVKIPGIGAVTTFIQSPTGFLVCILLPMAAFVIFQTIRVIRNFIAYKTQKATAQAVSGELSEEQKRLIAEEYMRSMQNAENESDAPSEQSSEDN